MHYCNNWLQFKKLTNKGLIVGLHTPWINRWLLAIKTVSLLASFSILHECNIDLNLYHIYDIVSLTQLQVLWKRYPNLHPVCAMNYSLDHYYQKTYWIWCNQSKNAYKDQREDTLWCNPLTNLNLYHSTESCPLPHVNLAC